MTTEIDTRHLPPAMQHFGQSLERQERFKHRTWIGVRVEALLGNYWRDRPHEAVIQEMMGDWIEALEWFDRDEITAACRAYLKGEDRARKPRPGDIALICQKAREPIIKAYRERLAWEERQKRPEVPKEDLEHRRRVAAEVLRKTGFAKRIGA